MTDNNELVLVQWTADTDEETKKKILDIINTSDNGEYVKCQDCDNIINENGGYYDDDLMAFMLDEGIIENESEYENTLEYTNISGVKHSNVVARFQMIQDYEIDMETKEITIYDTYTEVGTLYCSELCAKASWTSFQEFQAERKGQE